MLNKTEVFLSKNPKLYNHLYVAMANEGTQMGVDSTCHNLKKYSSKELIWRLINTRKKYMKLLIIKVYGWFEIRFSIGITH